MKKVCCVFFVLLLLFSLAGCGNKDPEMRKMMIGRWYHVQAGEVNEDVYRDFQVSGRLITVVYGNTYYGWWDISGGDLVLTEDDHSASYEYEIVKLTEKQFEYMVGEDRREHYAKK